MITINFHKGDPLYYQVYRACVRAIENEDFKNGDRLPSKRSLATHLGVSVNTITMAYNQLVDEGFVESKERSGFFVNDLNPTLLYKPQDQAKAPPESLLRELEASHPPINYNFSFAAIDQSQYQRNILLRLARQGMDKALDIKEVPEIGLYSLREAISLYLKNRRGVLVPAENIIVTSGFTENLFLLFLLLDDIIFACENPGYVRADRVFHSLNQDFITIPLDDEGISIQALEKTQANMVLTTPSNQFPTGLIMSLQRRQELLAWAEENKSYIVEDDYDSDFKFYGKYIPALKSLDQEDRVIMSGSFTQSVGPFLAVSYLVLPDLLMKKYHRIRPPKAKISSIQQIILADYLSQGHFDRQVNRMNTFYRKKRNRLITCLKNLDPSIQVHEGQTGLHFLIEFARPIPDQATVQARARKAGIFLESLDDYRRDPIHDSIYLVGFGAIPMEQIEEAAETLIDLFK